MDRATKKRNFSFVFHNVRDYDCKSLLEARVKSQGAVRYVCGCERYPDQDGQHIHLFVSFKNGRKFGSVIDEYQEWAIDNIVAPRPEGEERAWGRVEVDRMFGTFEQAKNYLAGLTKDKPVDPNISDYQKPGKGQVKCDVCGVVDHYTNMAADYFRPRGLGRCRLCGIIPHRMLVRCGHQVKDLDYMWEIKYQGTVSKDAICTQETQDDEVCSQGQ